METEEKDELGKLIISSNNAPLPWGKQQRLVDLLLDLLEKQELDHKHHTDKLEMVIKCQQATIEGIVESLKGCENNANSLRGRRQSRKINSSSQAA